MSQEKQVVPKPNSASLHHEALVCCHVENCCGVPLGWVSVPGQHPQNTFIGFDQAIEALAAVCGKTGWKENDKEGWKLTLQFEEDAMGQGFQQQIHSEYEFARALADRVGMQSAAIPWVEMTKRRGAEKGQGKQTDG